MFVSAKDASGVPDIGPMRSKNHHSWAVVAVLLTIGGIVGSVLAAESIARGDAAKSRQAFASSSAGIASTLQLAIRQEEDLIVSASGFVVGDPTATDAEFVEWANSVHALARYPELTGFGHSVVVSAADLPAFEAHAVTDPAGPLPADGSFHVVPPGVRPFYCLSVGALARTAQDSFPAGYDFCAPGPTGSASLTARDSGQGAYQPIRTPTATQLSILTPVYRGGVVPATVAARRAAFLGWVGMAVTPAIVLDQALKGHPNTTVSFSYHAGSSNATFSSGKAARGSQPMATDLNNGWTVTTYGVVDGGGLDRTALAPLITGVVWSILLGLLVFVLGTGRERARRLVRQRTDQLLHQALHDPLTGLPNRALVMDRIEQLLIRDRRYGHTGAVLYVDLDDFKNVNDTLGHGAGDRLLVAVAARLASTLRDADTIGRVGGDEFVVLIDGAMLRAAPGLVAERLLDVMRQPFDLDGASMPLIVTISIGIAIGDRCSAGDLLRDADVALYQAKAGGKNRYELFDPRMQTTISRRTDLEFELRAALAGEQYRLVYQPIYNLDDLTVVGVEALLRWDHPTLGVISPDEFIPILEQTSQIRDVGRWVLRAACLQTAAWHARGDALTISVNVSGRQLDHDNVVEDIRDALQASGLPATSLIIEVTETALMHNVDATARRLQAIKDLGVRIAIDDFGTGYSSLAYLRRFPVDCLKIDRIFTHAITTSPESKALIGTLVQLGKDLGLSTVAEGVETTDELDLLRTAHVDQAQGFLMARPLDPETLETQILAPTRPATPSGSRS